MLRFNEIDALDNINGIGINEIEYRSKIITDNTSDKENYRFRSFDGFLGVNESFKERLKKDLNLLNDWNKYYNLNITHKDLSNAIKELIEQSNRIKIENSYGPMAPIIFQHPIPKPLNVHNSTTCNQNFQITKNIFFGFQYSIFYNKNNEDDNEWNQKWNEDYLIRNLDNGLEIKVSGDGKGGILQFISGIGFYEGDESNPYRIDPMILISLLNGTIDHFTNDSINRKKFKTIENLQLQISQLENIISSSSPPLPQQEIQFLSLEIINLKQLIQQEQQK